ncbi:MAG: AAA family ATPase, partial [Candidatus Hydrogenedentes bacterium]|nr:AAA family ATPase [Candidatus Hydrogenedentota bacterium]
MTVRELLSQLEAVKAVGSEKWMALCPAHADKNPSLSVSTGEDGKTVLKCFAGCETQAIVEALGLRMSDLFPDAPRTNGNGYHENRHEPKTEYPRPWDWERLGLLEAVYPYKDEASVLLYEVLRSKDKHFSQRKPDGKGGWTWNLGEVRRVPYRLPELIEAMKRGATVYIVEGEKDVETLRTLGLTATCNSGGAGKWLSGFAEYFPGAKAVIIPDNDKPGRKHGESVAQSLHGKAASICVVNLPGLPEKGDVSDWLASGHNRAELEAIVSATSAWKPTAPVKPGYNLTWLGDLMNEPEEHVQWLLEDILPMSGTGLLAGKPKAGKTTLARQLALCVARGERFLERVTVKGPVIYLALEEKRAEVRKHFEDLGATGKEHILIHAASAPQKAVDELRALAVEHKPVLIIVDPLFRFIRVK